jgi:hypothetical protein
VPFHPARQTKCHIRGHSSAVGMLALGQRGQSKASAGAERGRATDKKQSKKKSHSKLALTMPSFAAYLALLGLSSSLTIVPSGNKSNHKGYLLPILGFSHSSPNSLSDFSRCSRSAAQERFMKMNLKNCYGSVNACLVDSTSARTWGSWPTGGSGSRKM